MGTSFSFGPGIDANMPNRDVSVSDAFSHLLCHLLIVLAVNWFTNSAIVLYYLSRH
jgi:hypothetical protein